MCCERRPPAALPAALCPTRRRRCRRPRHLAATALLPAGLGRNNSDLHCSLHLLSPQPLIPQSVMCPPRPPPPRPPPPPPQVHLGGAQRDPLLCQAGLPACAEHDRGAVLGWVVSCWRRGGGGRAAGFVRVVKWRRLEGAEVLLLPQAVVPSGAGFACPHNAKSRPSAAACCLCSPGGSGAPAGGAQRGSRLARGGSM
jgi:hypothetical protein